MVSSSIRKCFFLGKSTNIILVFKWLLMCFCNILEVSIYVFVINDDEHLDVFEVPKFRFIYAHFTSMIFSADRQQGYSQDLWSKQVLVKTIMLNHHLSHDFRVSSSKTTFNHILCFELRNQNYMITMLMTFIHKVTTKICFPNLLMEWLLTVICLFQI